MIGKINLTRPLLNIRFNTSKGLNIYLIIKLCIYTFLYAFIAIIILLSAASIIYIFQNPQTDNSNVIYYFFAAVAILANVCFSWSRSIGSNDSDFRTIVEIGEVSFLAALVFLFASLFKYANMHISNIETLLSFHFDDRIKIIFTFTVSLLYIVSYAVAIFLVIYACLKITRIVVNRNFVSIDTSSDELKK